MPVDDNPVIQAFRSFPANTLYFLASKKDVLAGFRYHEEQRVESYAWNKDCTVLEADLRVNGLNGVSFSAVDGKLSFQCDCHWWKPAINCSHVISALLTTLNLLFPKMFPRRQENSRYLSALKRSLHGEMSTPTPGATVPALAKQPSQTGTRQPAAPSPPQVHPPGKFAIVLKNREGTSRIQVQKDGRQVLYGQLASLPKELAPVSYWYTLATPSTSAAFLEYLNRHASKHPIVVDIPRDGRIDLRWDPALKCRKQTQFNLTRDGVLVETACLTAEAQLQRFEAFGGVVADLDEKRLGLLEESLGWSLYQDLYRIHFYRSGGYHHEAAANCGPLGTGHFLLPVDGFRHIGICLPRAANWNDTGFLSLKVNGETVKPQAGQATLRLTIDTVSDRMGQARLRAEVYQGDLAAAPPHGVFDFFMAFESGRLPAPLRAQMRKVVLCDAFFKLPAARNSPEGQKLIRETLAASDIARFRYRKVAVDLLRVYLQRFLAVEDRLVATGGQWFQIPEDKQKQALLYQLPFKFFGPQVFKSMEDYTVMSLPSVPKGAQLQAFYSELRKHGIDLCINQKKVVATRWEFSIDATRTSGIDWFEIKPEIRCNGVPLAEAEWLEALGNSGVREAGDVIQVLDENSQQLLSSVATILQARGRGKEKREIVGVQRLQILDWIALRKQGVTVKLSLEDDTVIDRLLHFEKIEPAPLPEQLQARLRPYQKEGYYWLAFLYQHRLGACLADDMGLGKTLQAITLLAAIQERILNPAAGHSPGPHLVVLPPSLLFNWESELKRFYPALRIGLYTGKERSIGFESCDVVLTTYGLVRKDIEKLKEQLFHVIVFDEAQAVKNIFADTTGATRQLRGYFKVTLTGTPLENHLGEYYSILDLCLPGLMGDYDQFKPLIKADASPLIDLILRRTRPFVLRRTKDKILKELPPKTESDVYLDLTEKQKSMYQHTVSQVRSSIEDAYRSKTQAQAQIIALTAILKLRQLCVSPRLLDRESRETSPKIEFLIGKLRELRDEGHSALVFSQFTSFLDLMEEDLRSSQLTFSRLDGSTAVKKRKHLVEGFQEGRAPSIFLLSLKAGGQGLNLTRASYVFHLDPWWNPAVENQASDRAHRIGQSQKVSITRILMRHTIEEKMMELKKRKLALYKAVLEDAGRIGKGFSISKSDFDFLLDG
ncbi:MAG: DEAD/DEAH box helicase [Acidobacteria bacterium]|nr:DEAD/DEAH box helicase [Acidobacteriota bacterium]